ncbi:hypothetical protein, partial [Pseudofrankia sp. EUN1h]|uniref:hypothetical protein n=2 Tax=Pseudofrankia TaxID=2994363 RepID=UPI0008DB2516
MTQTQRSTPAQTPPAGFVTVTAALCNPVEFPGELGDNYPTACATLGLPAHSDGYALLLGQDRDGARWTQVCTDVEQVAAVLSIWHMGNEASLDVDPDDITATHPGWPIGCDLALADRPAPHDPTSAGPVLHAAEGWAKTGRRRMADRLAEDLSDTRNRLDRQFDQYNWGDTDLESPIRYTDLLPRTQASDHPAVTRALRDVWLLASAEHPPPGSVRSRRASGGGHLIQAAGDGWSLVANTADPLQALLLHDDLAGMAVDVAGSEGMPRLLDALTATAARAEPPRPRKSRPPRRGANNPVPAEYAIRPGQGGRSRRDRSWPSQR